MAELKPCPSCGNKGVYVDKWLGKYGVVCDVWTCPRITEKRFPTKQDAIDAWNKEVDNA